MLGGNDIGPRGTAQLLFVAISLLMAAIINANIFGNITVLMQSLNRKASKFQEKLENASETMKNMNIPYELQDSVKSYLAYTFTTQDNQKDLDQFLAMLSPSLVNQISKHVWFDAISKNTVFATQQ